MKTFDVKVERSVTQTAVLRVEAKDKRTAALHADIKTAVWTDGEIGNLKVAAVDPVLPLIETKPAPAPVAEAAKGGKKAA